MSETAISKLDHRGDIAVLTIDSPPVNALGHAVRVAIDKGTRTALADPSVSALVIACAGRTFFAGADITEFGKPLAEPGLNEIFLDFEAAEKPVIAAIHGTALGGGFELALACHYRIATSSAKIGLPEVHLGLLPAGGGTQRTPRLAGIERAVDLIVGGKPISAAEAESAGLIDCVVEGDLITEAVAFARRLVGMGAMLRRARDLPVDMTADAARIAIADYKVRNPKAFAGFKAPVNIVKAIEAAASLPFDEGLREEWRLFEELVDSTESGAQRHVFFAERACTKIPIDKGVRALPIASVAVIGAGTMGTGITLIFLTAGLPVSLIDLGQEALERARDQIQRTLRGAAGKGRMTVDAAEQAIRLLTVSSDIDAIAQADLVIEAVFERLELKRTVFAQMDAAAKPGAILASNTSFLDLDAIAAATNRPEQVVGLHFFAPANIMRLLEVVRGARTSETVIATAMGLGRMLGKIAILSGVCDGFIANRAMMRRSEAAERLLLDSLMPWEIDDALRAFGFPMGVFEMLDLVGLDVIGWDRENTASRSIKEALCEMGRWGQKTGGGYYDYDECRRATPSPSAEKIIQDFAARRGASRRTLTQQEIVETLLDPVVNEGAKLLEEGIALRASDVDMALVSGYGWPTYSGGPMFWGDHHGLKGIVERLRKRAAIGDPVSLSPLLEKTAAEGRQFTQ